MTECETLFSKEEFIRAWVANADDDSQLFAISVSDQPDSKMYGVRFAKGDSFHAEFAPHGLFASSPTSSLSSQTLRDGLMKELKSERISRMRWHVRFDHEPLANALIDAGFSEQPYWTHALTLDRSHEDIFARYSTTRRNQIRKALRRGVTFRVAENAEDIREYCRLHSRLSVQKESFREKYGFNLLYALFQLRDHTTVMFAEAEGQIIAGAVFFVDGDSLIYWHGAADRDFGQFFPTGALMDRGIQLAIEKGLKTFNFGASSVDSLREFKASFGAEPRQNWTFTIYPERSLSWRVRNKTRKVLKRIAALGS